MTTDYLEEVLRALNPTIYGTPVETQAYEDRIWQNIVTALREPSSPRIRRVRRARRYWGLGAFSATVATVVSLLIALGGTPISAAAATLKAAAKSDAHAAALPPLLAGQYYYQSSQVSLVCQFSGTDAPANEPPLTYIANGTLQSWTTSDGTGKVVITPSAIDGDGSHFASAADEARWIALGKPFIPCALGDASNPLTGNPSNSDTTSTQGGYSTSLSGYVGFGFFLSSSSQTSLLSASTSINNLPQSASAIATLLANGQINLDGSLNPSPQTCPLVNSLGDAPIGCTASEQLGILEPLLSLPDASAKLGAVLYQVIAGLPGATLAGDVSTGNSVTGSVVKVPGGSGETFEVVLNQQTGALISCSEYVTSNGATSQVASISYGTLQVANGEGSLPTIAARTSVNNP